MITAAYGPQVDGDRSKSGFESEEAAHEYIKGFLCEGCLKDLEQEYNEIDIPGEGKERLPVTSVLDTHCGAEWFILNDNDFEEVIETGDFNLLLKSAGYKKLSKGEKTETWEKPN